MPPSAPKGIYYYQWLFDGRININSGRVRKQAHSLHCLNFTNCRKEVFVNEEIFITDYFFRFPVYV